MLIFDDVVVTLELIAPFWSGVLFTGIRDGMPMLLPSVAAIGMAYVIFYHVATQDHPLLRVFMYTLCYVLVAVLSYSTVHVDLPVNTNPNINAAIQVVKPNSSGSATQTEAVAPVAYLDRWLEEIASIVYLIMAQANGTPGPNGVNSPIAPGSDRIAKEHADMQSMYKLQPKLSSTIDQWRTLLDQAVKADPVLAKTLNANGAKLMPMARTPMSSVLLTAEQQVFQTEIINALSASTANVNGIVDANKEIFEEMANKGGGIPFTGSACPSTDISSCPQSDISYALADTADHGLFISSTPASIISAVNSIESGAVGTKNASKLDRIFTDIGTASSYTTLTSLASDMGSINLLTSKCNDSSSSSCKSAIASVNLSQVENGQRDVKTESSASSSIGEGVANVIIAAITKVISYIAILLSFLVKGLSPLTIALMTGVAYFMGFVGLFQMIIPGRFLAGIKWMIGPIIWVKLWKVLFIAAYGLDSYTTKFIEEITDKSSMMPGATSEALVDIFWCVIYIFAPLIAKSLVFDAPGQFANILASSSTVTAISDMGKDMYKAGKSIIKDTTASQKTYSDITKPKSEKIDGGGSKNSSSISKPSTSSSSSEGGGGAPPQEKQQTKRTFSKGDQYSNSSKSFESAGGKKPDIDVQSSTAMGEN